MSVSHAREMTFSIVERDGQPIAPGEVIRTTTPLPGDPVVIFNYPDVLHFVVDSLEIRDDWWPHDWLEPQRIVLRRAVASRGGKPSPPLVVRPGAEVAACLRDAFDHALVELPEKTSVHMSREDFELLCESEGISADLQAQFAARAYCGVPLKIGPGEDRGSLVDGFAGDGSYAGDYGVIYVTRRDGAIFQPNADISATIEAFFIGTLPIDAATLKLFNLIMPPSMSRVGRRTLERIADTLRQIESQAMPRWLAVQELTELHMSLAVKLGS